MSKQDNTIVVNEFIESLHTAIKRNIFAKLTLSKSVPKSNELKNMYWRKVEIQGAIQYSCTYRYQTRDIVKNYSLEEMLQLLQEELGSQFKQATLLTLEQDLQIQYNKKYKARLQSRRPTFKNLPEIEHNKQKEYAIAEDRPFLQKLGLSSSKGKILASQQDKYRQINKYVEIMDNLLAQVRFTDQFRIVDMGSGKGYLTFALHDYLQHELGLNVETEGIELREKLCDFCNEQVKALEWKNLSFKAQDIFEYEKSMQVLIALHACDVATDIAIAKGIQSESELIVVAPCCHKQIRKEMDCQTGLQAILKHGILQERQAEMITDGIRALLLEAHGYKTKVFEFISSEHTGKNIMITAHKQRFSEEKKQEVLEKVQRIKTEFGIKQHYLEQLLEV